MLTRVPGGALLLSHLKGQIVLLRIFISKHLKVYIYLLVCLVSLDISCRKALILQLGCCKFQKVTVYNEFETSVCDVK